MVGADIGIDLGTTTTIIYMNGEIMIDEPSIIAIDKRTNEVIAVGSEALRMLGRTPGYISAEFPLKNGVISDYQMTEFMIKEFIKRICGNLVVKPKIAICIPSFITGIERRAVFKTALSAGARRVVLVEEPIAAAIGSGLDISKPVGKMVVDIGGGTADIAVISAGGVVVSKSVRTAGNHFNDALVRYISETYKILIGDKTAEQLKIAIGTIHKPSKEITHAVKGRNLVTGLPQKIEINQEEIYAPLVTCASSILDTLLEVMEETPPELAGDVKSNGILMTGGGSLLKGFPEYISEATKVNARVSDNPIECVSIGTGRAFEFVSDMQEGFSESFGNDDEF